MKGKNASFFVKLALATVLSTAFSFAFIHANKITRDLFASAAEAVNTKASEESDREFFLYLYDELSKGMKLIASNKKSPEGYVRASRVLSLIGNEIRAGEFLLEGLAESPKSILLWEAVAQRELKNHRPREAISVYQHILTLDEHNHAAHHAIAYLLLVSQVKHPSDLEIALSHAEKAHEMRPKNLGYSETLSEIRHAFEMSQ